MSRVTYSPRFSTDAPVAARSQPEPLMYQDRKDALCPTTHYHIDHSERQPRRTTLTGKPKRKKAKYASATKGLTDHVLKRPVIIGTTHDRTKIIEQLTTQIPFAERSIFRENSHGVRVIRFAIKALAFGDSFVALTINHRAGECLSDTIKTIRRKLKKHGIPDLQYFGVTVPYPHLHTHLILVGIAPESPAHKVLDAYRRHRGSRSISVRQIWDYVGAVKYLTINIGQCHDAGCEPSNLPVSDALGKATRNPTTSTTTSTERLPSILDKQTRAKLDANMLLAVRAKGAEGTELEEANRRAAAAWRRIRGFPPPTRLWHHTIVRADPEDRFDSSPSTARPRYWMAPPTRPPPQAVWH